MELHRTQHVLSVATQQLVAQTNATQQSIILNAIDWPRDMEHRVCEGLGLVHSCMGRRNPNIVDLNRQVGELRQQVSQLHTTSISLPTADHKHLHSTFVPEVYSLNTIPQARIDGE